VHILSTNQLIEQFISDNLPNIDVDDITTEFEGFWNAERQKALERISKEEGLATEKMQSIIEQYLFTEREPLRDDVISLLDTPPTILQRKKIADRIIDKMKDFVKTFLDGMGM
jgi:type I restriction enzyme R subunit